jgi:glycosyltransferase involved in cell wall biosynthesis
MVAHDEDLGYKKPTWMRRPVIGGFQWLFFKLGVRLANVVVVQHGNQLELLRRNYHKDGILRMSAHRLVSGRIPSEEKSGILWVARCEKWKDPTSLIGLARCFRDVSFVMIAPQTPDREFFLSIKEKAAGENNIKFVDHVPFGEIQRSFNKARLFVNTSLSEGFPNTFVQAAMGATPIISLYVDPDGVLEKNKMGLCARGDFNRMVADIKTLLGDEALWQKMSDNAYAYARRNHDIAHIIEDDKQMLVGLMEEH